MQSWVPTTSDSSWCMGLPSEVSAILDKEGFTSLSLAPLKHATEDDTKPNFSGLRVVLRLRSPESTAARAWGWTLAQWPCKEHLKTFCTTIPMQTTIQHQAVRVTEAALRPRQYVTSPTPKPMIRELATRYTAWLSVLMFNAESLHVRMNLKGIGNHHM